MTGRRDIARDVTGRPLAETGAPLVLGEEHGDARWFLRDRPIQCGRGLELLLPGGQWVGVRFEVEGPARSPVFYMPVAGTWETWKPPVGKREGQEIRVGCDDCDGTGRGKGRPCEGCFGEGVRYRTVERPAASMFILRPVDGPFGSKPVPPTGYLFRWPEAKE